VLTSPNALLGRGILAVIVGVIAIAWVGITLDAIAILFAVYAFLAAGTDSARAFSSDRVGPVIGWLLLALLSAAAGVGAVIWPAITIFVLVVWIGVWALVAGLAEIFMTFRPGERPGTRILFALSGLVSVLLGVVLTSRPDIGALTLALVFGLFSLTYGVSALVLSFELRAASAP
jgi:uncharacterized membrane protein HdeD (DUF308 family)